MILDGLVSKHGTTIQLSDKVENDEKYSSFSMHSSTGFGLEKITKSPSIDITQAPTRPTHFFGLNHSHSAAEAVFHAYLKRIQKLAYDKFDDLSDAEGLDPAIVTEAIEASGKYLKSLDEYGTYRKFIGTTILLLKNNHDNLTAGSARALVGAIEVFSKSTKQTTDLKNFIRTCQANGISVVRLRSA